MNLRDLEDAFDWDENNDTSLDAYAILLGMDPFFRLDSVEQMELERRYLEEVKCETVR
jgi:hypothetical protein